MTAARECEEEVKVCVKPDKLQLLAITNRIQVNRYGVNGVHYYYLIDINDTTNEIEIDPREVIRALFIPLEDIAHQKSVQGLRVMPFYAALARHILKERVQSGSAVFNYDHQLSEEESNELYEKPLDHNLRDIMTVEFIS